MSKIHGVLPIIIAVLLLAGCSTQPGKSYLRGHADLTDYNPQNYQGCTVGEYVQPVEGDDGEAFTMRWWDCKDKTYVSGNIDMNGDGTPDFNYTANDVVGSSAAEIRASVEKAFSDNAVEAVPSVVDGIVESLKLSIGTP